MILYFTTHFTRYPEPKGFTQGLLEILNHKGLNYTLPHTLPDILNYKGLNFIKLRPLQDILNLRGLELYFSKTFSRYPEPQRFKL